MKKTLQALMFLSDEAFAFYMANVELTVEERKEIEAARVNCKKIDRETEENFKRDLGIDGDLDTNRLTSMSLFWDLAASPETQFRLEACYEKYAQKLDFPYMALRLKYQNYLRDIQERMKDISIILG